MKRIVACILAGSLFMGCASTTGEGTALGAGAGAVLGAIGAWAMGGDAGDIVTGGLVGAGVGGAIGYTYGSMVDKELKSLQGKENDLNAQLTAARNINQASQENRKKTQAQMTELSKDYLALQEMERAKTLRLDEVQAMKTKVNAAYSTASTELQKTEQALVTFRSSNVATDPVMEAEIAKLNAYRDELKGNTMALAAMNQRL